MRAGILCSAIGLAISLFTVSATSTSPPLIGKFNQVLDIGSTAPQWEPLPATDDKQYGSSELSGSAVTIVLFTCNTCPYAIDYEERLLALQNRYAEDDRVRIIAINSNAIPDDSLEKMQARAAERGFKFVYLKDGESRLAEQFGAVRTPEWFVLNQDRQVVYMGAYDDSPKADEVKQRYVDDAIEATLNATPIETSETAPVGCLVRRPRRR